MGIEFLGEARNDEKPSVRDCYEAVAREYLSRHGIKAGRRGWDRDPTATYQSDLIEDEVGNIHLDRECELANILESAMPPGIAKLIARAAHTMPGYWATTDEAQQWRTEIEDIIHAYLKREASL